MSYNNDYTISGTTLTLNSAIAAPTSTDILRFFSSLSLASGTSGNSGSSGTSGSSGLTGATGTSGSAGTSGVSGSNGTSGTSGLSGSKGTSGTSGLSGASGSVGTSGLSGVTGSNGTSGLSGISGTNGTNATATLPLSINTNVISISLATTSTNGYLSSIDWNTFNGKLGGTLNTYYVPRASGSNTLVNSTIYDNGTNVNIGNTSNTTYTLYVNGSIYATADISAFSDQSVKNNIRPIDNVLERVKASRGVVYDRTDIVANDNIGFIAQELEINFPELISTNEDGTKAVKYQNAVAILFEAVKELSKQIDELKSK